MKVYKPTVSQQLIWLDQLISKGSSKYNIGGYARLEGALSYPCFHQAVHQVLISQEIYSCTFREDNGEVQVIVKEVPTTYEMGCIDFSMMDEPERSAIEWMEKDFSQAFEMEYSPLFTFKLLRIQADTHFWYAKIHHLIGDGWSFRLLLNQTAESYSAGCKGEPLLLPVYLYSDYAVDDEAYYQSQTAADDRIFWLNEYKQLPPAVFHKQQQSHHDTKAGAATLSVNTVMKQRLQKVADQHKVSLFQCVIGLMVIYFGRTAQQDTIAIGMPVLNRTKKVYRQTAGVFMNLLSLPFDIKEDDQLSHVLQRIKHKMSQALRHQRYQYGNLVKDLKLPHPSRLLYDIRVSYEDFDFTSDFGGLKASAIALSNLAEVDPLAIYMREYHGQGFDVRFIYNTDYIGHERVQSISDSLERMIADLPVENDIAIQDIQLVGEEEQKAILKVSAGEVEQRLHTTYIDLWLASVAAWPDHIAVSSGSREYSYRQVNEMAIAVAQTIIAKHSGHTNVIGLLLPRSEVMIVGMLASMMAGIPYIPIDTEYPWQRINYMLQDAGCTLLLTSGNISIAEALPSDVILIEETVNAGHSFSQELSPLQAAGAAPCYIIYTSGSTGNPKGVVIKHRSLADYVYTFREYFSINETDVILQQASISFDTSVEEIFPVLSVGGRVHILENRIDLQALHHHLLTQRISILSTGPWIIDFLNQMTMPPSLRILISGGDVLKHVHIQNLVKQRVALYNSYGPTESTVCATYYRITGEETSIPIGSPIANRQLYILDNRAQLLPFETEGEIHIGGEGLAMAYLNRPGLTEEKFIDHPFRKGEKLYKTGDRGMLLRDGNFVFKGRQDNQISYRGYRIEAGEVEAAINEQPGVRESVVTLQETEGTPVLVAFIQFHEGHSYTAKEWRQLLSGRLPHYMIPGIWIAINEFPLLPNGKINKKELPVADNHLPQHDHAEKLLPQSDTEKQLSDIWQQLLKHDWIGVEDSFFDLGGHSLNVFRLLIAIREQFGVNIELHDLFEKDTIRMQAEMIANASVQEHTQPGTILMQESYPLTHAQQRLWIVSQLEEASLAYHIAGAIQLQGTVNVLYVQQAVTGLIDRHESLRTVFFEDKTGTLHQKILCAGQVKIEFSELHINDEQSRNKNTSDLIRDIVYKPFDLAQGPLLRTALVQVDASGWLLVYVMHHIISDGWSMEILKKEFIAIYSALVMQKEIELPVTRSFKDYIYRINEQEDNPGQQAEKYWLNKLKGNIPVLDFPAQHTRPPAKTYEGREVVKHFDIVSYQKLTNFCTQEGITLFMALFAGLNVLVQRYTGQSATVIGTPIANRTEPGLQNCIGLFLNMLAIKTEFKADHSFRELVQIQKRELLQAYKYHQYPMDRLVQQLNHRNDPGRSPLFDVLIVLHNQSGIQTVANEHETYLPPGLQISTYENMPVASSQFDLSFSFFYNNDSIKLCVEYNTSLFEPWFAVQIADHYQRLITASIDNADSPISHIDFISPEERHALALFSDSRAKYFPHIQWHEHLAASANRYPGRAAVVIAKAEMSYGALWQQVNRTASFLQHEINIQPGDTIGVMLEPCEWLPVYLLAIWMAGGIYVPVNPVYPEFRRRAITEDAACKYVLTAHDIRAINNLPLSNEKPCTPATHSIAYILYTSGTTGKPKGVMVSHEALQAKLQAEQDLLSLHTGIRSCLLTNYSFDVSFLELLLPLLSGGTIIIPDHTIILEPEKLAALILQEKVNLLQGTPTYIDSLFRYLPGDLLSELNEVLQVICIGGESLNKQLSHFLSTKLPAVTINNHYGPTESVIDAIVNNDVKNFDRNIIGRPLPNVRAYVLDDQLQLLPAGVIGELYIGGMCLAEGYINNQVENEMRFVNNPFVAGERIYKTGDLVKWTTGGELEFIGRSDEQVKIRGLRVEPEEIRNILEQHEQVLRAYVCCHEAAQNQVLVAFVIPRHDIIEERRIRYWLQDYLPDYMIPSAIIQVHHIPTDQNGKTDKEILLQQLPAPAQQTVLPRNATEQKLAELWERLLGRSPVSIHDNFFDLGGNSMLLVKMRMDLKEVFGIQAGIKELFRRLTIEDLAIMVDSLQWLQQPVANEDHQQMEEFII